MYAVGRLGSYITRGVYTVAGPFHPFGGAVDIIVVEQPDGTFKSSPWYVRFGKFQGVLKAKEKVVNICVNGVDANFHMYLNQRGEAYFLREEQGEEGESVLYRSSSSDEADEQSQKSGGSVKSSSYNYESEKLIGDLDASNGRIVARTASRRSKVFGFVFGRRSTEGSFREGGDDAEVVRIESLERAEIAANLLEVQWSTNLAIAKTRKDTTSRFSASSELTGKVDNALTNEEQRQAESSMHESVESGMRQDMLDNDTGLRNEGDGNISQIDSVEETSVEMPSLGTKSSFEIKSLHSGVMKEKCDVMSELSRNGDEANLCFSDRTGDTGPVITEVNTLNSEVVDVLETCSSKKFDEEQAYYKTEVHVALPDVGISDESGSDRVQFNIHSETPEGLVLGLDGSSELTNETLYLANGGADEVYLAAGPLQATSDLLAESTDIQQAENFELETERVEAFNNGSQNEEMNFQVPLTVSTSYTHMVSVDPVLGLVKEVKSPTICNISSFSNLDHRTQDERSIGDEVIVDEPQPSVTSVTDPEQLHVDYSQTKAASVSLSETSEEEQFLFSDLDESKLDEKQYDSVDVLDRENDSLVCPDSLEGIKEVGAFNTNGGGYSSPQKSVQENLSVDLKLSEENSKPKVTSDPIGIYKLPGVHGADIEGIYKLPGVHGADIERLVESLPTIRPCIVNLGTDDRHHSLSHSLDSPSHPLDWTLHGNDRDPINLETDDGNHSVHEQINYGNIHNRDSPKNVEAGVPTNAIVANGGRWSIWPFRRSTSRNNMQPALDDTKSSNREDVSDSSTGIEEEKTSPEPKVVKKKEKATTPTSEQLASLNLQEGRNIVTFTFSTSMLGNQKVDASIYLWKWNTRIVISDVDGTITRSDVLGQFMPMVGIDWSQTGVAHLFSAIKENGYQLLFLSARAISQAHITRQFLVNLKQDGKALPDGPVVISPDGLFPSLFREVIRRAPHEFKIGCLEDIKALFPPDLHPFYAGFGNRDTDEISYLKVGIPRGKIFIINPKGEVAVHRRVDTKSYTSLHDLVHDMFPPMTMTSSDEQEDFNSWNFWRLPPPSVDF